MTKFLVGLVIATGLIMIASILLQPGKIAGLGEIGGGAEALFGKKKAKGFFVFLWALGGGVGRTLGREGNLTKKTTQPC